MQDASIWTQIEFSMSS